jgi:hypothetical protein
LIFCAAASPFSLADFEPGAQASMVVRNLFTWLHYAPCFAAVAVILYAAGLVRMP